MKLELLTLFLFASFVIRLSGVEETDPRLHPINGNWGFHQCSDTNTALLRVLLIGDSIVGADVTSRI